MFSVAGRSTFFLGGMLAEDEGKVLVLRWLMVFGSGNCQK